MLQRFFSIIAVVWVAGCGVEGGMQAPPGAAPLDRVDFPPYETQNLDNGLRVFALEHREQPVVSIQLVVTAGSASDPGELPGLATFASELLLAGTTTRQAQEIAETIDFVGGSISARTTREATIVSVSALADSTDLSFELLQDVALNPAFASEEIERLRQQTSSSISANLQDPDFIADTVFNMALYGRHPYAHPGDGTLSSVQRIERDDVVAFHDTYFVPNMSALIVAGAVAPSEAFRLAEEWFGGWEEGDATPPRLTLSDGPTTRRIVVIDNPASVQTEIRIGQTMLARKDPDYFPMLVASDILGGTQGRLIESLREQRGLTYGAYEAFVPRRGPGTMYATTETRTERTVEAVELILEEIRRLRSETVAQDELERVKAFLIGSFPLTIETPDDLATRLANVFIYELGSDYLATYRDELAAITSADVARVSRDYLIDEGVLIVLVGNSSAFAEGLRSLGPVEVIPLRELDLDSTALGQPPSR